MTIKRVAMAGLVKSVEQYGSLFVSRRRGVQCLLRLREELAQATAGEPFLLALPPSHILDVAFADACLLPLAREIVAGETGAGCFLLQGLNADAIDTLNAAMAWRSFSPALLAVGSYGDSQLLGHLEKHLVETLDVVTRLGRMTATDLAKHSSKREGKKLSLQAANNRLSRLHEMRLVRREQVEETKRRAYVYYAWQWAV
jgi:hypothetical protein